MKIKILKIKKLFASMIIILLIITASFTTVNSSSLINVNNEKNLKEIDKTISIYSDENDHFKQESIQKEKSFTKFLIVINFIKLFFKDSPEIVSLCQHIQVIQQILPDSICRIIYWFVFYPVIQILNYFWYNHPDYIIQYYAFLLLELVNDVYYYFCDWIPISIFNSKSVYGIATVSELITSSDISSCPCIEK